MAKFCKEQAEMLNELDYAYPSLHPRAKAAILSIASTALKFSAIALDNESSVLSIWLPPVAALIQRQSDNSQHGSDGQVPILELGLLRNLLTRFSSAQAEAGGGSTGAGDRWFQVIHERALVQTVVSMGHHALRTRERPELVTSALGVLLTLVKSGKQGCDSVLNNDLVHLLWLPLSELKDLSKEWIGVFTLTLELVSALLRQAGQRALETSISFVALLQDQLTSFLLSSLSARATAQTSARHIELTGAAASFVSLLFAYYQQWQLHHPASLANFYHAMARLLNSCASLLIRPSVLRMLITKDTAKGGAGGENGSGSDNDAVQRARRVSTASAVSADTSLQDGTDFGPDVSIQNKLLDITSSCLTVLSHLSPKLTSLLTNDVVDFDAYQILLQMGFSTPSFDQDDDVGLTYGTIISVSNLCIRNLTKTGSADRSPSPAKSPVQPAATATPTTPGGGNDNDSAALTMDRRRLVLVLEQSLYVLLAQSLLILNQPESDKISGREKQLLRRELGAELGSVVESMRRYIQRGNRGSTGGSERLQANPRSQSVLTKSDEQFMKLVSTVVQKAFK